MSNCPNFLDSQCDSLGDTIQVENWCGLAGVGGTGARDNACSSVGISGEYGLSSAVPGCYYKAGTNCSGGGIAGNGVSCRRIAFLGDVEKCCTTNLGQCFVNNNQKEGTCPPDARSTTGQGCINFYTGNSSTLGYCNPVNFDTFQERWSPTGYCSKALTDNALANNYQAVSDLGTVMMNNYFTRFNLSQPGSIDYDPFQERILEICQTNPTACSVYLQNNLCRDYTRDTVVAFPDRQNFCGCNLPSAQYNSFVNTQAGVTRECDSVCTPAQAVKPVVNGTVLQCKQTVCVIDDVTINIINSSTGDINFSQVCSGCTGGNCNCYIKDVNINGDNSKIKNIDFDQQCSSQKCYVTSEDTGLVVEVPCKTDEEEQKRLANLFSPDQTRNNKPVAIVFIIIGVLMVVLLIVILLVIFLKRK